MPITIDDQQKLAQLYADYGSRYKGRKEDYFSVLYLMKKFRLTAEEAVGQVAFGNNDYGFDAYYIDRETKNLYLYQFKWSENHNLFKESLDRVANDGIPRLFGNPLQDPKQNDLMLQIKEDIEEHRELIDRVYLHFVFKGDLNAVENSDGIKARREKLDSKKWIITEYFCGRQVDVKDVEFISDRRTTKPPPPPDTHTVSLMNGTISTTTEGGAKTLYVGFVKLMDLQRIHKALGQTFFNRNIRAGLSPEKPTNVRIRQALIDIVIKQQIPPAAFAFNHNGITLAVEKALFEDSCAILKVPRLLNGAQTLTSLEKFLEDNRREISLNANTKILEDIYVLVKIVEFDPMSDFITMVTISNNQQNPVEPWNLRANDRIQCDLQDKFKEELGIFYSRQENAFQKLLDSDLEEMGIEDLRDIRIKQLAQTFLASQGEIDRMSRLRDVFDNQKFYQDAFKEAYLHSDARRIVMAYKVGLVLNSPMEELSERAPAKLQYVVSKARNLVWSLLIQSLLNGSNLKDHLESYGCSLQRENDFRTLLRRLSSSKVLPILKRVLSDNSYQNNIQQEKYSFLRTNALFRRCMQDAFESYEWTRKSL